jgi:hypothetical protein
LNSTRTILYKSFVQTFYKQNAGLFAFLLFIMVASVGRANAVGLLEYHFTLIRAMLTDGKFLAFVLIAWLLYALKCEQFMADKIEGKNYNFLSLLNSTTPVHIFVRMLQVQYIILLPVTLYALICVWIGITHHWYVNTGIIVLFILTVCLIESWRYTILIRKRGMKRPAPLLKIAFPFPKKLYIRFVLRYISTRRKMLFLAVKIFSCFFLFGMLLNRSSEDNDFRMFLLFYSFGLMGHGVLIYKIRQMEETSLGFYRSLPVSLPSRFLQYAFLYLILLIPEIMVIVMMTPVHLAYPGALLLIFFGWAVLLVLNGLLFLRLLKPFDYLKIVSGIYLMIFIAVLAGITVPFTICLFLVAVYLFFQGYYKFEMTD